MQNAVFCISYFQTEKTFNPLGSFWFLKLDVQFYDDDDDNGDKNKILSSLTFLSFKTGGGVVVIVFSIIIIITLHFHIYSNLLYRKNFLVFCDVLSTRVWVCVEFNLICMFKMFVKWSVYLKICKNFSHLKHFRMYVSLTKMCYFHSFGEIRGLV